MVAIAISDLLHRKMQDDMIEKIEELEQTLKEDIIKTVRAPDFKDKIIEVTINISMHF